MFEEPLATEAPAATEEKGMSIPVIGSSEFPLPEGQWTRLTCLGAPVSNVDSILTSRVWRWWTSEITNSLDFSRQTLINKYIVTEDKIEKYKQICEV